MLSVFELPEFITSFDALPACAEESQLKLMARDLDVIVSEGRLLLHHVTLPAAETCDHARSLPALTS